LALQATAEGQGRGDRLAVGPLDDEAATSAAGRLQSGLREFRIEIDSLVQATTCKLRPCAARSAGCGKEEDFARSERNMEQSSMEKDAEQDAS